MAVVAAALGAAAGLGAAALGAAAALLASLTGPELPLGLKNSPDFVPEARAALMCELTEVSLMEPSLLLALMYFVMA